MKEKYPVDPVDPVKKNQSTIDRSEPKTDPLCQSKKKRKGYPNPSCQLPLRSSRLGDDILPDHTPTRPRHLKVEKIILAKGSLDTSGREQFIHRICSLYPNAKIEKQLDKPHNKVKLETTNSYRMHKIGKGTLVFGVLGNCVRQNHEEGNLCPPYWHFSTTGFCFFDCTYCYLAGTPGVWFSPTIKIYVNLEDIFRRIDRIAAKENRPISFYLGKLQDGLSLDPLTAYSTALVPFFAKHPTARQILLTKSDEVDRLVGLDHKGHTILCWSLNPAEIVDRFEKKIPSVDERMAAMKRCFEAGYPVRAIVMPMIPVPGWQNLYQRFFNRLLHEIPLDRLTIAGICNYRTADSLMKKKLSPSNPISDSMESKSKMKDGRMRYPRDLRLQMYEQVLNQAARIRPELAVALCMEEENLWRSLGIEKQIGKCNCVL